MPTYSWVKEGPPPVRGGGKGKKKYVSVGHIKGVPKRGGKGGSQMFEIVCKGGGGGKRKGEESSHP